ncbi:MAG TPA: class I SAM-dependent methyltransferase [Candidatus Acidoferrales bacterium]|nr:class I SAM-dependent methyltransferase [Candidatus Acidoferrales bacterium]
MLKWTCKKDFRFAFVLLFVMSLCGLALPLGAQNESAARDVWQRPNEVMDALGIKPGSVVADVGAGSGYFTFHLAERVGPSGKVYAEDVLPDQMVKLLRRAKEENLSQIQTIMGVPNDPRLPVGTLDAILVCNAYHEMHDYDAMLQGMYKALKPGGMIGIIDATAEPGQPRESYYQPHHIPKELVRDDLTRNSFHFVREGNAFKPPDQGSRSYYFLIFEKPKIVAPSPFR